MTRTLRTAGVAVALSALLLATALAVRAAVTPAHAHTTVQVVIQGFAFSPQTITIAPGTTVTWTQKDSAPHTVTSDNGSFTASSELSPGQTYSLTFSKPGTYTYHCAVHPNMTATVIVTGASTSTGNTNTGSPNTGNTNTGSPSTGHTSSSPMMSMGTMSKSSLPSWTGYYDGHKVLYLSTDTSSKSEAARDHIRYAPALAQALPAANKIYFVTNGGFAGRGPAFGSEPGESDYTPLWQEVLVTWKDPSSATFLGSDNDINAMAKAGKVTLKMTGIVLNCPIIKS